MALAKKKLLHSSTPDTVTQLEGKLAIIDVVLTLNYEPLRKQNHDIQNTLVESHSRIVFAIPKHREFMRTGYPSEPLLAEAANQILHQWEKKSPSFCIDNLLYCNEDGMLAKGHVGEMVARLILSGAYRHAVAAETNLKKSPNFSAGCSLVTFINELLPEDHAEVVLNSGPDNVSGGLNFKDAFKDAVVRFTHFVTMSNKGDPKNSSWGWTNMAWAMFVRSAAIICHPTQETIDLIIPILLSAHDKIDEHAMSAILIQVKNRTKAGNIIELLFDADEVKLFQKKTKFRPYIALVMDLGIAHRIRRRDIVNYQAGTDRHKVSRQFNHQRYYFIVSGCSEAVYKNIDKNKFDGLLGAHDVFCDHARQDPKSLGAVRKTKPVWEPGIDCFGWVDDPILRTSSHKQKHKKEGVFIGGKIVHDNPEDVPMET